MKKQFSILLILVFVFGLIPFNCSKAITQNQIDAEVQIVCTDGANRFSGSGTIIDPKGIILTNRHVVEGAYKDTCFIGFIESINKEPNFGTAGNYNLAEVKYKTTTDDMDAAILYLDNPTNKTYPYVNIWDSNSASLKFGDKVEVIGFPSIGGSTITYTSGDFSGFGSSSDGTLNYIKTTAPLEHGNSGGGAYNSSGQFIGIPTMGIAGTLGSLGYILSINSIKSWLSTLFGVTYQNILMQQSSATKTPTAFLDDYTPSYNLESLDYLCYNHFDDAHKLVGTRCFPPKSGKIEEFNHIQFNLSNYDHKFNFGNFKKIYYYFDNIPHNNIKGATKFNPLLQENGNQLIISPIIDINAVGKYYFSFFAQDESGNVSGPVIYEYFYEKNIFKTLQKFTFFSDTGEKNILKVFNVDILGREQTWQWEPLECVTSLPNLTVKWDYPYPYNNEYVMKKLDKYTDFSASFNGDKVSSNKYTFNNLPESKLVSWEMNLHQPNEYGNFGEFSHWPYRDIGYSTYYFTTAYHELFFRPITIPTMRLEGQHKIVKLIYDPNENSQLRCYPNLSFTETNERPSDPKLINRLKGQILLHVESKGEAYYIYPDDSKRYYLGRPADAFNAMRKLGLGATHEFITSHTIYPDHVLGKILLDVDDQGKAYYIYPKDKKAYYLGKPADAFKVMRDLGLGITTSDLNKIPNGNL